MSWDSFSIISTILIINMTTIKIFENGPAIVNNPLDGIITVVTEDGTQTTTEGKTIAICRCGLSAKLPYCDGSHKKMKYPDVNQPQQ